MSDIKKIVKILCDTLLDYTKKGTDKVGALLGASGQSVRNWRKAENTIQQAKRSEMCDALDRNLSSEEKDEIKKELFERLMQEGIYIPESLYAQDLVMMLRQLFVIQDSSGWNTRDYNLISRLKRSTYLDKVMEQKMEVNAERYGFFQVDELADNGIILNFWNLDGRYDYKVLVEYLCEDSEQTKYRTDLSTVNAREKKKLDVEMILRFSFWDESEEAIYASIRDNIYMDKLNIRELDERTYGKDFIYVGEEADDAQLLLANRYSDVILGHLSKYFTVIYKNIFFRQGVKTNRSNQINKNKCLLWNAKIAEIAEIDFEREILEEMLEKPKKDLLIIYGFLGFPMIESMQKHFKKIICLDNALECIRVYGETITKDSQNKIYPEAECDIEFAQFTASVADYVTREFGLYHQADMIIIGVGNASLIRQINKYFQFVNQWLKPDGMAWFSFFNEQFPYDYQSKIEMGRCSTYFPMKKENRALVSNFRQEISGTEYYVYCKLYEWEQLQKILGSYFSIERVYSYPLLSFLTNHYPSFPFIQNILQDYDKNFRKDYDKNYSQAEEKRRSFSTLRGYYISVLVKKQTGDGITIPELHYERKMEGRLAADENTMILKTLLLKDNRNSKRLYVVLLPKDEKLPETEEHIIMFQDKKLQMLSIREMNELGVEVGCIPPFFTVADMRYEQVCRYCCIQVSKETKQKYVIESGEPKTSLVLTSSKFAEYLREYEYMNV